MTRSVVLHGTPRCSRCHLPPRWCICPGLQDVDCPVQVDVLMHPRETARPSSTGHLIKSVLPSSRIHPYVQDSLLKRESVVQAGKTLWIMHPRGEPLPAAIAPAELQVLLLDGNWRQAGVMVHTVKPWGRLVCLPAMGTNRYWLRSQAGAGSYCTVETLIFLLGALGLQTAQTQLRLDFELHVYAGLCSRGAKARAADYLSTSTLRDELSGVIARVFPDRL